MKKLKSIVVAACITIFAASLPAKVSEVLTDDETIELRGRLSEADMGEPTYQVPTVGADLVDGKYVNVYFNKPTGQTTVTVKKDGHTVESRSMAVNSGNVVVPIDINSGASSNYTLEIVSEKGSAYGSFTVR